MISENRIIICFFFIEYRNSCKAVGPAKGRRVTMMADVSKSTRIKAIAEINRQQSQMQNGMGNGQSQESVATGGNSFTEEQWKKIIRKMDEYLSEVKKEQQDRFEQMDKKKEIEEFYQKLELVERCKKSDERTQEIVGHINGETNVPYGALAKNGVVTYNGVSFVCDYEKNALCLGDMTDEKDVITVALEEGGVLKVNRNAIDDLSVAIAMFSPEDIRRILVAIQQDAKVMQMQQELEEDKIRQLFT